MSSAKATEAVKQARNYLFSRIRNDWEFEHPLDAPEAGNDPPVPFSALDQPSEAHDAPPDASGGRAAESSNSSIAWPTAEGPVLEWRERTYASSDPSETSDDDEDDDDTDTTAATPTGGSVTARKPLRPHQTSASANGTKKPIRGALFAHREVLNGVSAGEVGEAKAAIDQRRGQSDAVDGEAPEWSKRKERKRRRKKRFEEEMEWNEGLRYWAARRDAWCCAKQFYSDMSSDDEQAPSLEPLAKTTSSVSERAPESNKPFARHWRLNSSSKSVPTSTPASRPTSQSPKQPSGGPKTLVPLPPPILPASDPTRQNLTPQLYPSIYSKVVKQSLTPSVPINLSHVVPALVQGWKADGEWPSPATIAAQNAAGQHLYLHVRGGASALDKARNGDTTPSSTAAAPSATPSASRARGAAHTKHSGTAGFGFGIVRGGAGTEAMLPGYHRASGGGRGGTEAMLPGYMRHSGGGKGGTEAMLPGYLTPAAAARRATQRIALAARTERKKLAAQQQGAGADKRARKDAGAPPALPPPLATFPVREEEGDDAPEQAAAGERDAGERAARGAPPASAGADVDAGNESSPKTPPGGGAAGAGGGGGGGGGGSGGVRKSVARVGKALRLTLSPSSASGS